MMFRSFFNPPNLESVSRLEETREMSWYTSPTVSYTHLVSALCLVLYGGSLSFAVFYLPLALINPAVYCFSVSKVE